MATLFKQKSSNLWYARVKLWDDAAGEWVWKKKRTGHADKDQAMRFALTLEDASNDAKAGLMTRAKAIELVEEILRLSGACVKVEIHTMEDACKQFLLERLPGVGLSSGKKYEAHIDRLTRWAGDRLKWHIERWDKALCSEYYADLRTDQMDKLSMTTANNHMPTLSMIFLKAAAAGHMRGNPVSSIELLPDDSMSKEEITRGETAKTLRAMRKQLVRIGGVARGKPGKSPRAKDFVRKMRPVIQPCDRWVLLTLLGWHTGHRIQDLLTLKPSAIEAHKDVGWTVSIQPAKKAARGGRMVVLPIPAYLAKMFRRVGGCAELMSGDNRNGRVSSDFIAWLKLAGVDASPVQRGARSLHAKSFHSFRHSMSSRLTAAGVSGELARLVTDHDSAQIQKGYVHAEVTALAGALKKARRKG